MLLPQLNTSNFPLENDPQITTNDSDLDTSMPYENITSGSLEFQMLPDIPYLLAEIFVAILALVGNALTVTVFAMERKLRRLTNYYIVSLALADLLVGLIGVPFAILTSLGLPRPLWACLLMLSTLMVLCTVSIFCLVAVSIDRYWAILFPLLYSRIMKGKIVRRIILLCWVAGLIVGFLPLFGWHEERDNQLCFFLNVMNYDYLVFLYFFTIVGPGILMAVFYTHIYTVVIKQAKLFVRSEHGTLRHISLDTFGSESKRHESMSHTSGSLKRFASCQWMRMSLRSDVSEHWREPDMHFLPHSSDPGENLLQQKGPLNKAATARLKASSQVLPDIQYDTVPTRENTPKMKEKNPQLLKPDRFQASEKPLKEDIHKAFSRKKYLCKLSGKNIYPHQKRTIVGHKNIQTSKLDSTTVNEREATGHRKVPVSHLQGFIEDGSARDNSFNSGDNQSSDDCEQSIDDDWSVNKAFWQNQRESEENDGVRRSSFLSYILYQVTHPNKKEVKAAKNLSIIVLFFMICWFPLYTINCVQAFCSDCHVPESILKFTIILSHANSAVNPFLYAYHMKDFQYALKVLIFHRILRRPDLFPECRNGKGVVSPHPSTFYRVTATSSAGVIFHAPHAIATPASGSSSPRRDTVPGERRSRTSTYESSSWRQYSSRGLSPSPSLNPIDMPIRRSLDTFRPRLLSCESGLAKSRTSRKYLRPVEMKTIMDPPSRVLPLSCSLPHMHCGTIGSGRYSDFQELNKNSSLSCSVTPSDRDSMPDEVAVNEDVSASLKGPSEKVQRTVVSLSGVLQSPRDALSEKCDEVQNQILSTEKKSKSIISQTSVFKKTTENETLKRKDMFIWGKRNNSFHGQSGRILELCKMQRANSFGCELSYYSLVSSQHRKYNCNDMSR